MGSTTRRLVLADCRVRRYITRAKIADCEKVATGHARWPAQWPAVRVLALACALACGMTAARANRALTWQRGP